MKHFLLQLIIWTQTVPVALVMCIGVSIEKSVLKLLSMGYMVELWDQPEAVLHYLPVVVQCWDSSGAQNVSMKKAC